MGDIVFLAPRVPGPGFRVPGPGPRSREVPVPDPGFRVRVLGSGFRVRVPGGGGGVPGDLRREKRYHGC